MRRIAPVFGTWLALASSSLCFSCAARGPSDAAGPSTVRFEDPDRLLREHESEVRALIHATLARVAGELPVTGVTFTVAPGLGIPGYGLGGYTPSGSLVQLSVDPSFPDLARALDERLPRIVAHELHHARRWRGPGYGSTLLEALVSEGLADRFAVECLDLPLAPWSDALSSDQESALLARARAELDSASYGHARWFFGADPELPNWTGYTLGYRLVQAYQAAHPGQTAAQLVDTRAAAFRP